MNIFTAASVRLLLLPSEDQKQHKVWSCSPDRRCITSLSKPSAGPFSYPGDKKSRSGLRGIWYIKDKWDQYIYHQDQTKVQNSFKGRTKLLGDLSLYNCTLEIDQFKDHDAGSYCFRIEIPTEDNYSFNQKCAKITVTDRPEEPQLHHPEKASEGISFSISCTVTHTCPAHMPVLTWSHGDKGETMTRYTNHRGGTWEVQSTLTFIPQEQDDDLDIICTAQFHGGLKAEKKMNLRVKPKGNMFHIVVPVVAAVCTALLFGGLCFLMRRKYKRHIEELKRQGNYRSSIWSRISRLSRRRGNSNNMDMDFNNRNRDY
ncbi:hypothetical protein GN956_G4376 [Arapaima gigas]